MDKIWLKEEWVESFMNENGAKVLIVDDEQAIRQVLAASLKDEGYSVECAEDGKDGLDKINSFKPDVVLLDIWMPGELDGLQVLDEANRQQINTDFIVMSGHGTIETAVKATKLGAWDFVEKPLSIDKITILLSNVLAFQNIKSQKNSLLHKLRQNIAIVGRSVVMMQVKEQIARRNAKTNTVLLLGEMGVGKSLAAQNLHYFSPRAGNTYIDVNCQALPEELAETEIFGCAKEAFTGSEIDRLGKLQLADRGTLFLKEVDHLPVSVQEKLLLFLKTGQFTSYGGEKQKTANVCIIAASNANLPQAIKEGRLLQELYELMDRNSFYIPPLRERLDDLEELCQHFTMQFEKEGGFDPKTFSKLAYSKMAEYTWPGNVRELRNFIERIYLLTDEEEIGPDEIKIAGITSKADDPERFFEESSTLKQARVQFEKEFILKKLDENDGNISKTAESIGVERSHLHRKIKSYGIDQELKDTQESQ